MINSLNELSDIYLGNISEADNSPEAVKGRVMQYVRAIRYRARKEGETLNKAYNEFMGSQSGVSSTEKQMVKERLGLTGGSAHVGEGYQRDPEQSKKDRTHSSQPDPSKDGFTGIGNMSIKDIMKLNAKIKAKTKKEETSLADLRKASALSASDDPKDQDEARRIKTQMDYESLMSKKKVRKEGKSDWRTDLREIASDIPVKEKEAERVVKEKKVNNKITINPVQGQVESFAQELGGELIEAYEIREASEPTEDEDSKEVKQIDSKQKKANMIKKQVLVKKLQAVRSGAEDIVAHFEPEIDAAAEYFFEQGVNEEGLDIIIEELGLEEFLDFVTEDVQVLNEERSARKASVRAKSYADVKAAVDKSDAAKKKAKKGEYAPSYAKKETDVTVYDDKPAAKKKAAPAKKAKKDFDGDGKVEAPKQEHRGVRNKKITKAVTKAKIKQPEKKATKQGLGDKIRSAYKAGVKRHRKSTQGARVFAKGFASGAKKAVKFAKDVKKVVSEEELLEKESYKTVAAVIDYDRSKKGTDDAVYDSLHGKKKAAKKERDYAAWERSKMRKDDPNWKHKKGSTSESVELEDLDGNLAFEVVDIIKAPSMKTVLPAAQFELVDENYEKVKTGEVLSAFKRDPKVRKRFEKAAKKDRGPGSVRNQAADDMLQTAKDIAKRKGDTSKSDDRYAYEQVELKKNSKGRHPRDQKELERAQEYIKKNPNFGKVSEAKVDQGRSDYGKASIRNYRRKGPGHGEPAMFDPENKRGKLIDKRREEHKARRGVKKAKVPAYKVSEGVTFDAWKKAAASALRRKKDEKKPSMDKTTRKLHKWRTDKEQAEREKYVTFTKPVEDD